ncbi:hypothetical protein TNCV_3901281 [Trichonephila clavipes]|nr:hypothetical protein TNCV_3901281 [Trichonephila clavipes]
MSYQVILIDQLPPTILAFYPDGDGLFMKGNAIIHRLRNVQKRFAEHQSDFQHLPWPPHSPDLSPGENVWELEERCIPQQTLLPSILQDL